MQQSQPQQKERDIKQIVNYLCHTFNKVTSSLDRAARPKQGGPNLAYKLETEFSYKLNDLMQSPPCLMQKHIADCNEYIDEVMQMMARRR